MLVVVCRAFLVVNGNMMIIIISRQKRPTKQRFFFSCSIAYWQRTTATFYKTKKKVNIKIAIFLSHAIRIERCRGNTQLADAFAARLTSSSSSSSKSPGFVCSAVCATVCSSCWLCRLQIYIQTCRHCNHNTDYTVGRPLQRRDEIKKYFITR